MEIVIIGQNEGAYIRRMRNALREYPYRRIWVLDRCTDNSEKLLHSLGEEFVKTPDNLKGRQTSFARNLGLKACSPAADALFLDGDRYPVSGSLYGLEAWKEEIALLTLSEDFRNNIPEYSVYYGAVMNGFYSCGLFMRRSAIDKVMEFQQGELFSTSMQEVWGIEDTYLGDVCYHLGLTANVYSGVHLRGAFDRLHLSSLNVVEQRFRARENLCVKWY